MKVYHESNTMPAMKCFWYPLPHQMDTYRYICTCFPRTHTKKTWREKYLYDCPLIHDNVKPNNPIMVILFLYTSYFVKVVVYLRNIFQDQMLVLHFISRSETERSLERLVYVLMIKALNCLLSQLTKSSSSRC